MSLNDLLLEGLKNPLSQRLAPASTEAASETVTALQACRLGLNCDKACLASKTASKVGRTAPALITGRRAAPGVSGWA